jgi:hypothetical protein
MAKQKSVASTAVAPEVIAATHARLGKKGKDSVPAGLDYNDRLRGIADQEGTLIVGMFKVAATRMDLWRQVGKLAESKPEILKSYPDFLKANILIKAGLPEAEVNYKKNAWPVEIQGLYERFLGARISEARRVMLALQQNYTSTMAVLAGEGTIQQKLIQLPKPTARGRKPRPASVPPTPETRDQADKVKEAQNVNADNVMSFLANTNADGILKILQGCTSVAKRTKEYQQKDSAFRALIDKLDVSMAIHDSAGKPQYKAA